MSVMAVAAQANLKEEKIDDGVFARRHDGSFFEFDGSFGDSELNEMLKWASERKASDIRIQTDWKVMADIGGEIHPITRRPLSQPDLETVVRYVYGPHGPGMIKGGYDLDPSHEVRMKGVGVMRYRVNATGGRVPGGDGIQVTIRPLPSTPIPLSELGIEQAIIDNIRPQQGMVLVTGPTGSGKSTLLSSMMREILTRPNAHEAIVEFSAPIEYVYDGLQTPNSVIWQTEVPRHLRPHDDEVGVFAYAVRNALRRKPTVILLGEARDRETIQASVEAALTGHLLYTTMHVIGVPATLRRAVQPFPGDEREAMGVDIMESLRMIVTQLLFPRKGGGRVALREFMIFDEQTRSQFMRRKVEDWPRFARSLMQGKRVVSQRMSESAWLAYEKGLIESDVFKKIVAVERDQA